jgi:hypothetical protein
MSSTDQPKSAYELQDSGYTIANINTVDPNGHSWLIVKGIEDLASANFPEKMSMHEAQGDGDETYVQIEWSNGAITNHYSLISVTWKPPEPAKEG